ESHLSDKGVLTVCASKTIVGLPEARNIPIQASPKEPETTPKSLSNGAKQ
ncbi:unnamed protein product, partial [Cercopithifilaria johnstoni]